MHFSHIISGMSLLQSGAFSIMMDGMFNSNAGPDYKSGKQMIAEALTGKIRSNIVKLEQGSKNAVQAASMAELADSAINSISADLQSIQTTLNQTANPGASQFDDLFQSVSSKVSGTQYNGISLLDGSQWSSDDRVTDNGDGTGTVQIHLGYGSSNFSLRDFSSLKDLKTEYSEAIDALNSGDSSKLDSFKQSLQNYINDLTISGSLYKGRAEIYTSESKYMSEQANILKESAASALSSDFDLLNRGTGGVVSTSA